MRFDKKALIEALKEPLRLLVLALIPFALAWLTELQYDWAIGMTVLLRFIDKWLHESAKLEAKKTRNDGYGGMTGITGF